MHANKPETFSRANVMQGAPIKANLKFLANLDEPLVYIPSKGGQNHNEERVKRHTRKVRRKRVKVLDYLKTEKKIVDLWAPRSTKTTGNQADY